jgi:hypothetical protein
MFGTPGTDERIDKTIDREGRAVRKEEERPQVAQGISYPAATFGAPLGGGGISEVLALTTQAVDPALYAAAAEKLLPSKSIAEFAAEYDELYAPEPVEAPDYKFDKYLALARLGVNLMQPTPGGAIAPALANAGDAFIKDLASISERQRQEKARLNQIESAQERERRNFILQSAQASDNAVKALQAQLIVSAFGFNQQQETRTNDYIRDLNKMFYQYQYTNDTNALKKHMELLRDQYQKDPKVLYDQETGTFRSGYIQQNEQGVPIPYFPVLKDGQFTFVPKVDAIVTNFTLNDKDDFDPGAKQVMELASKINSAKQSLKFIRDVQQSIIENPGIVGLPGFFQQFTQSVGSTAFDIMDALKAKGAIDSKSYDKNVNRIQNSVISHLKENYVRYNQTGDKNANNFSTDRANGTDEYEIYRTFFNPEIPKNQVRLNSIYYALARARKATGRLNVDDIRNAKESIDLYSLGGSDTIKASLNIIYEQIEAQLKSDLGMLDPQYENLIQNIPYTDFVGQTAGQDTFISSSEVQEEFVPSTGNTTIGIEGNQNTDGAPVFDEGLTGG